MQQTRRCTWQDAMLRVRRGPPVKYVIGVLESQMILKGALTGPQQTYGPVVRRRSAANLYNEMPPMASARPRARPYMRNIFCRPSQNRQTTLRVNLQCTIGVTDSGDGLPSQSLCHTDDVGHVIKRATSWHQLGLLQKTCGFSRDVMFLSLTLSLYIKQWFTTCWTLTTTPFG